MSVAKLRGVDDELLLDVPVLELAELEPPLALLPPELVEVPVLLVVAVLVLELVLVGVVLLELLLHPIQAQAAVVSNDKPTAIPLERFMTRTS